MDKLFKEYAQIREQKEELETLEEKVKGKILDAMTKEDAIKAETEYGTFSRATRLAWTYSKKVTHKEEDLKILKKQEQDRGIAKSSATEYISFRPTKE